MTNGRVPHATDSGSWACGQYVGRDPVSGFERAKLKGFHLSQRGVVIREQIAVMTAAISGALLSIRAHRADLNHLLRAARLDRKAGDIGDKSKWGWCSRRHRPSPGISFSLLSADSRGLRSHEPLGPSCRSIARFAWTETAHPLPSAHACTVR